MTAPPRPLTAAIEAGDVTITPCPQPATPLTAILTKMTPAGAKQETHKLGSVLYTFFETADDHAVYLRTVPAKGAASWYAIAPKTAPAAA